MTRSLETRQPFVQSDLVGRVLREGDTAGLTRRKDVPGLRGVVSRAGGEGARHRCHGHDRESEAERDGTACDHGGTFRSPGQA